MAKTQKKNGAGPVSPQMILGNKEFIRRLTHAIGHELKQPLGLIRAYSYYIKKNLTPDQNNILEYPAKIDTQVDAITELLNAIVDHTKLLTGSLNIHPEEISCQELQESFQSAINELFPDRNIIFFPASTECSLLIDKVRTIQSLLNLITNAVKYSEPDSKITVNVTSTETTIKFSIVDTGMGIPLNEVDVLFDPYVRTTTAIKSGIKGLGLGLTLAKDLTVQQGGSVTILESSPHGTTVELSLPVIR